VALSTSKPTGELPYPLTVLAGPKGVGKTWAALEASASTKVDRTFVITLGEVVPNSYALIPGARFENVDHDGTYESIHQAVLDIRSLAAESERPNLTVLDTGSALWDLIVANKQAIANERARAAARQARRVEPTSDVKITPDLWTEARNDWYAVLNPIRTMPGPTVITARMEETTVIENGRPTTDKVWRIRGEGNLPYDATVVVELTERGEYVITKANSPLMKIAGRRSWPHFTMDDLWDELGLDSSHAVGVAQYALPRLTDR
jgi:hypothetical protein